MCPEKLVMQRLLYVHLSFSSWTHREEPVPEFWIVGYRRSNAPAWYSPSLFSCLPNCRISTKDCGALGNGRVWVPEWSNSPILLFNLSEKWPFMGLSHWVVRLVCYGTWPVWLGWAKPSIRPRMALRKSSWGKGMKSQEHQPWTKEVQIEIEHRPQGHRRKPLQ